MGDNGLVNRFTVGFAAGYVLGARAGRERYDQMKSAWDRFIGNPKVQQATQRGKELAGRVKGKAQEKAGARAAPPIQSIQEVMTPDPFTVSASTPVLEVASTMRQGDVGAVIVLDDTGQVLGIVTDRDITVRAVAEGRDPTTTTVGEVCSQDLTTLSPTDTVQDAVQLMRERAVRRLPVVEGGVPVGIVSIGDLAIEREPQSALADISAAPPNQ